MFGSGPSAPGCFFGFLCVRFHALDVGARLRGASRRLGFWPALSELPTVTSIEGSLPANTRFCDIVFEREVELIRARSKRRPMATLASVSKSPRRTLRMKAARGYPFGQP